MKKILMVIALALPVFAQAAGDWSLIDHRGVFHNLSWYSNKPAVVVVAYAGDDETRVAVERFATAFPQAEYFLLFPGTDRLQPTGSLPVLQDSAGLVAKQLNLTHWAQAVVIDPAKLTTVYSGPLGVDLIEFLGHQVAGHNPAAVMLPAAGVEIRRNPPKEISYVNNVAPILAENCATCHRAGGIGPFALDSALMAQGWSPMIREVVMTKRMPPGQLDPHVGSFTNSMTLSVEEQQTLVEWADAGAPLDVTQADPLATLTWPESKWEFGEPDFIIQVPPQEIPATGVLDYITMIVPIEIEQDQWVKASQYVAGDRTVLHHTLNAVIEPGQRMGGFANILGASGGGSGPEIAAYVPGGSPRMMPENTGGLLKKGSSLFLQLHYTTMGRATTDASEIGLWFYPEGEEPTDRMSGDCACIFTDKWTNIPPYDPAFTQIEIVTVPEDLHLYTFLPHMHFRGKSMRAEARYPDGSVTQLINVANYNYNWQISYEFVEPVFLPKGTEIVVTGVFDNSEQNPANPDPARSVPWGQQSDDEMFFGAMTWKVTNQAQYQ
jgi:hypothetical protein